MDTKTEYSIEKDVGNKGVWQRIYIWKTVDQYVAGATPDLHEAYRKLNEHREWANLNNYDCSYRVAKSTITTEVLEL